MRAIRASLYAVVVLTAALFLCVRTPVSADPEPTAAEIRVQIVEVKAMALELAQLPDGADSLERKAELAAKVPAAFAKIASTSEGRAQLVEDPQIGVDGYIAGGLKIPGFGGVSGEISPSGVKFSGTVRNVFKVGAAVGERSVEFQSGGSAAVVAGVGGSMNSSVGMTWGENLKAVDTLPKPPSMAFSKVVEEGVNKFLGSHTTEESRGTPQAQMDLKDVLANAAKTAFADVRKATGTTETQGFVPESLSAKASRSIDTPYGGIAVSNGIKANIPANPDQPVDVRSVNETSVSIEYGNETSLKGVRQVTKFLRSADAKVGFTFSVNDDTQAGEVSAARKQLAAKLRAGASTTEIALEIAKSLWPLHLTEDVFLQNMLLKTGEALDGLGLDEIVKLVDPKVGGVRLCFGKGMTEADIPITDYVERLEQMADAQGQRGSFKLGPTETVDGVLLVSLDALAEGYQGTLGYITSLRGYVRDARGKLWLAGTHEAGEEPIPTDDLAVALVAIYQAGNSPFISLDPDANDMAGPQKVRIGGMPRDLEKTGFVHAMVEADYLMKQLDLGAEDSGVPEFESTFEILRKSKQPPADFAARMWFVPGVAPCGDVLVTRDGDAQALWFENRVQVQTESMRRTGQGLIGMGESDPISRQAARNLTRCFPKICKTEHGRKFARLRQIFEVAKLAAILRARKVQNPSLEALCKRKPAAVAIKETYDGIGPVPIAGTSYQLSGGASARAVPAKSVIETDALKPLIVAAGKDPVETASIALPARNEIDGSLISAVNAELWVNSAQALLCNGETDQALEKLDAAISADNGLPNAHALRAMCRLQKGSFTDAVEDAEIASAAVPELAGLLSLVKVCAGQISGGLEAATRAEKDFADNADVLSTCALSRMYAEDFAGAEKATNAVLNLSPLDFNGRVARTMLAVFYGLSPADATRRVRAMRAIPFAVSEAMAQGQLAVEGFDIKQGAEHFTRALTLLRSAPIPPAAQEMHLLELLLMMHAQVADKAADFVEKFGDTAGASSFRDAAYASALELKNMHPDWPITLLILMGVKSPKLTDNERRELFVKASTLDIEADPLRRELNLQMGTRHAEAVIALGNMKIVETSRKAEDATAAISAVAKFTEGTSCGPMFRRLADIMRDGAGKPDSELQAALKKAGPDMAAKAKADIPQTVAADPADIMALNTLMVSSMLMMGDYGPEVPDEATRLAAGIEAMSKPIRMLRFSGASEAALQQAAVVCMSNLSMISWLLDKRPDAETRGQELLTQAREGKLTTAQITAAAKSYEDDRLAPALKQLPPSAGALLTWMTQKVFSRFEGDLLREYQTWLQANRAADDPEANAAAVRGKELGNAIFMDGGLLQAAITKAEYESELRVIAKWVDVMGLIVNLAQGTEELPGAKEMRKQVATLRALMQGKRFAPTSHDWVKWRGDYAAPAATESTEPARPTGVTPAAAIPAPKTPATAGDSGNVVIPAAICGGLALLVLGLFAGLKARRRQ